MVRRREAETKFQNSVSHLCCVQQGWLSESCESQLVQTLYFYFGVIKCVHKFTVVLKIYSLIGDTTGEMAFFD